MTTIRVQVTGLTEAVKYFDMVKDRLQHDRHAGLFKVVNRVADVWLQNFREEGSMVGGWRDLDEFTVMRREEDGFPGTNPILERSGALKSVMVDQFTSIKRTGFKSRNDSYSAQTTKAGATLSGDGIVRIEAHGWKVSNQYDTSGQRFGHPARPIWFVDKAVLSAAESGLIDWVEKDVLRP